MKNRIAIVGGGIGGLSAGIYLSKQNISIDLYEKNNYLGGKANQIISDDFRFDTGPSIITLPYVIEDLFHFVNENIDQYFHLIRLDIICKYFYEDGSIINSYNNLEKLVNEISNNSCDSKESVTKYLGYVKNLYGAVADSFLFNEYSILRMVKKTNLKSLFLIMKSILLSMNNINSKYFKDFRILQMFNRYATYAGSTPYKIPAVFNTIQNVEYNIGTYFIREGIYKLIESIETIALNNQVKIIKESEIKEIVIKRNKAIGLIYNDKFLEYDKIIINVDKNTSKKLIGDITKIEEKELSSSAIIFYWAVKGESDILNSHNILFSIDYKKEFDEIFKKKIIPFDPTIYIFISSKINKKDAPIGFENWHVMINTPPLLKNNNINLDEVKKVIINKISRILKIDIENRIVNEAVCTPEDLEESTGSYGGSIYGNTVFGPKSLFTRNKNKDTKIENLFYCGGSVHPGGGIPLVILSGKITANLINKELEND